MPKITICLALIVLLCISLSCATIKKMPYPGKGKSQEEVQDQQDGDVTESEEDLRDAEAEDSTGTSGEADSRSGEKPGAGTQYRVIRDSSRLRQAPSLNAPIATTYKRGTTLSMLEWTGNWMKVLDEHNRIGFIHITLVEPEGSDEPEFSSAPASASQPQIMFEAAQPCVVSHTGGANIRSGPGTEFTPPLFAVSAGTPFTVQGKTGKWYYGVCCGKCGWIYSDLLNTEADAAQILNKEPEFEPDDAYTIQDLPAGSGSPQGTTGDSGTRKQPENEYQLDDSCVITGEQPVSVRAEPSRLSRSMGELAPGDLLKIVDSKGNWLKVRKGRLEGWVPAASTSRGVR